MNTGDERLEGIPARLAPVVLPPADFPPAQIVRDTPREELRDRIRKNAEEVGIELTEAHWEVIDFLLDFYTYCCETHAPRYTDMRAYWRYIDCLKDPQCESEMEGKKTETCQYGQLSATEATSAYLVYRVLLKAFADKGGKKHLYELFPYGPVFTIHLLAGLPRLRHDVDPHFGTAY